MRKTWLGVVVATVATWAVVWGAATAADEAPGIFDFGKGPATRPATRPAAATRPATPAEPVVRAGVRKAGAAVVKVECEWGELATGAALYANAPDKKWGTVPEELAGRTVSLFRLNSKSTTFVVERGGEVTIACVLRGKKGAGEVLSRWDLGGRGWQWVGTAYEQGSGGKNGLAWEVFSRRCEAGEAITLQTDARCAPVVIW